VNRVARRGHLGYLLNRRLNCTPMFENLSPSDRVLAIQRLTALWAFNECGLGGVLHALQSPFTGLVVGSIAMICIALICVFAENKWQAGMTSLVIVLVIKALVSPHSSPTAYIAVTFQAVTGAFIYKYIPNLTLASIFFVCLGLIESACQRILTLTILYGNSLWEAVDIWGKWVAEKWGLILPLSSSYMIIVLYLFIHLIAGVFIGWSIYKIIIAVKKLWGISQYQLHLNKEHQKNIFLKNEGTKKRFRWKRYALFVVLMLLIVVAYSINEDVNDFQKGMISVARAFAILGIWFLFIGPFVMKLLRKYLQKKHNELSVQVGHTLDMIPELAWLLDKAWKETQQRRGFARIKSFVIHSLLYILQYKTSDDTHTDRADTQS